MSPGRGRCPGRIRESTTSRRFRPEPAQPPNPTAQHCVPSRNRAYGPSRAFWTRSAATSGSSCSQMRMTVQPCSARRASVSRSRTTLAANLSVPPLRVVLGKRRMLRAAVPEASVHEHRDFAAWKYQIGPSANTFDRRPIHEVPESASMQLASKCDFGFGVAPTLSAHPSAGGRIRRRHRGSLSRRNLRRLRDRTKWAQTCCDAPLHRARRSRSR